MQWSEFADRVLPILGFVVFITLVAELADRIGVFAVLADWVAVRGALLVPVLLVACTAALLPAR